MICRRLVALALTTSLLMSSNVQAQGNGLPPDPNMPPQQPPTGNAQAPARGMGGVLEFTLAEGVPTNVSCSSIIVNGGARYIDSVFALPIPFIAVNRLGQEVVRIKKAKRRGFPAVPAGAGMPDLSELMGGAGGLPGMPPPRGN